MRVLFLLGPAAVFALIPFSLYGISAQEKDLAQKLRDFDARILTADQEQARAAANMLWDDLRTRIKEANLRETANWRKIKDLAQWEKYRDERIEALRQSLGKFPPPPKKIKINVTKTLPGDGYQIKNITFASRPGLLVTANLYLPAKQPQSMPGILIVHSHHNPKTQGELQDMGMLWARLGCAVLVMDQVGHGERRQHPFITDKDYPKSFKPGRQDYYFRYNVNQHLQVAGESLMGWMAWDLMRGVDVLLDQPNIDKKAIILMGAVAGGGDPCAVTAALDKRITAAVPFNFGGPQPETKYPLGDDAEDAFNYAGGGSWESTRNLKLSARDGFLPWVIVGSLAPRPLIYAHEFAWDKDRDPVWKRLQQIYQWYKVPDHLAAAYGAGSVKGSGPGNTHCNNIGAVHRRHIYPPLKKWFDIPIPKAEFQQRKSSAELLCLTPELAKQNQPVYQHSHALAKQQIETARKKMDRLVQPGKRKDKLRQDWSKLLGGINAKSFPKKMTVQDKGEIDGVKVQFLWLHTERDIQVPALMLIPRARDKEKPPLVVGVAQQGHLGFMRHRAEMIAELLQNGVAVCLPDVRGTGETQMGSFRGRTSSSTSLSATELMLGGTILGSQCNDLLAVMNYLRSGYKNIIDPERIALWGDSFAPVNDANRNIAVPLDAGDLPDQAEPMGASLALLTALFDDRIHAVHARGGLGSILSTLESPFLYLPHDAIIPGMAQAGDLCDLAVALAPRPLSLEAMITGTNQPFALTGPKQPFAPALKTYQAARMETALRLSDQPAQQKTAAAWLVQMVKK